MTTATLPETVQTSLFELPHTTRIGSTVFWCIQLDCDGVHHFYCSCEH